jgi:hypothetical protein
LIGPSHAGKASQPAQNKPTNRSRPVFTRTLYQERARHNGTPKRRRPRIPSDL